MKRPAVRDAVFACTLGSGTLLQPLCKRPLLARADISSRILDMTCFLSWCPCIAMRNVQVAHCARDASCCYSWNDFQNVTNANFFYCSTSVLWFAFHLSGILCFQCEFVSLRKKLSPSSRIWRSLGAYLHIAIALQQHKGKMSLHLLMNSRIFPLILYQWSKLVTHIMYRLPKIRCYCVNLSAAGAAGINFDFFCAVVLQPSATAYRWYLSKTCGGLGRCENFGVWKPLAGAFSEAVYEFVP